MAFSHPIEPLPEDDHVIRAALQDADIPSLLPTLAYVTGDLSLLRDDLRPDPTDLLGVQGGLTEEQQQEARELAFEALVRWRDAGSQVASTPSPDVLGRIASFAVGPMEHYMPLLVEELGDSAGHDARAPQWSKDEVAPDAEFRVAVVGAGMSGLLTAYRLQQAGVPYVVLEKNADVGGTWLENLYPGCRVDVTNHLYSYSFVPKDDWPQHFSTQDVLLDYFRDFADEFGLRKHIRFETEVLSAEYSDERATWTLRLRTPGGEEETLECQAVVSAVGQLNRPSYPSIEGAESFAGPTFHSARWDHDVDLAGKRVAVIGTGCSAAQFIPIIAEQVAHLDVFQRTANWFAPTPDYHEEVALGLQWLFRHVPYYSQWHRFWLFCVYAEGMLPATEVDPEWPQQGRSVSAANDEMRALLTEYIEAQFPDDPVLREKVVPTYPPAAKRMIRDNGVWAATLKRDNVDLVTEDIERITPQGIVTKDGQERPADVLIYATGFTASHFLTPMKVKGRGGVDLHEQWNGDARAYMGIALPSFPNFFLLYGPNTNIVVNGSIIFFSECEVNYVLGCLRLLLEGKHRAMDVKKDAHDAYNVRIDEGNRRRTWGASTVNSWYKNANGRVSQNWPFTLLEYWQQTQEPIPADYELL